MATAKKRRHLVGPEKLAEIAEQVTDAAREEGVRAAIGGGFAMQLYGSPRLTADLDIVADESIQALPRGEPLTFGGERTAVDKVPVDVIVRDDDYRHIYTEALNRAAPVEDMRSLIIAPEYLAVMKMIAGRPKDYEDFRYLVTEEIVDLDAARDVVRRHLGAYAAREFDRLVDEARWLASRERRGL